MIDIQHYQNVAAGDTVAETQKSYQAMLATSGTLSGDAAEADTQDADGRDPQHDAGGPGRQLPLLCDAGRR